MNFTMDELNYSHVKRVLESNGFGLVEVANPYHAEEAWFVRIWARVGDDGVPAGGECGQLVKDLGFIGARYTMTINSFYIGRTRLHGLLTDIANNFVPADLPAKGKA